MNPSEVESKEMEEEEEEEEEVEGEEEEEEEEEGEEEEEEEMEIDDEEAGSKGEPEQTLSPEVYNMLVQREAESLRYLLTQTRNEISKTKQECVVLTELLIRRKFRNIAEVKPAFGRDRKKRGANEPSTQEKPKKERKTAASNANPVNSSNPITSTSPPPAAATSSTQFSNQLTPVVPSPVPSTATETTNPSLSIRLTIKKPQQQPPPAPPAEEKPTKEGIPRKKKDMNSSARLASKMSLMEAFQAELRDQKP